jgi:hypothetical protein
VFAESCRFCRRRQGGFWSLEDYFIFLFQRLDSNLKLSSPGLWLLWRARCTPSRQAGGAVTRAKPGINELLRD